MLDLLLTGYQKRDGKVPLSTDCWTAPNHRPILSIMAHVILPWTEDGKRGKGHAFLLDFVELPRAHTGKNLADEVAKVVHSYGIEDKVSKINLRC